jgi:hypothetical protein
MCQPGRLDETLKPKDTTMKNTKNSRFDAKGCYTCRCCKKLTRETGGEESSRRICGLCDDKGALECRIMDTCKISQPMKAQMFAACEAATTREEVFALRKQADDIIDAA